MTMPTSSSSFTTTFGDGPVSTPIMLNSFDE